MNVVYKEKPIKNRADYAAYTNPPTNQSFQNQERRGAMKIRFCIGIAVVIVLLMVGISGARTFQVNAAMPQGNSPGQPWVTDFVSTVPNAGSHVSIAFDEDNGNTPWIAYYSESWGSLMVARYVGAGNGNCYPNEAWMCEQVDAAYQEYKGLYTSIDTYPDTDPDPSVSTWKVGVSYYDATKKSLKYAEYTCPPTYYCKWTIQTVDSSTDGADDVGRYTSLKFSTNGTPTISYNMHDDQGVNYWEALKYAYYTGVTSCGGNPGWMCEEIDGAYLDDGTVFGGYTSLDIDWQYTVNISYYDGWNKTVKYAHYTGGGGGNCSAEYWECRTIDTGTFSSIHARTEADDIVRIAYYNPTAGTLMYAWDIDEWGNCGDDTGWQCDTIELIGAGFNQLGVSLAVDDENVPMIAYTYAFDEQSPLELKVASPTNSQSYANCGGEPVHQWWCQTLEYGDAYQNEAAFLGLGIKSNGLAMVAYSEEDSYAEETYLKIAYQTARTLLPLVVK